ncbi:MAG TPA: hypothetical protein VJP04_04010 [Terriglobales bacterium]|nr:hypothetical protein [Terriglobales bacterium]
MKVVTLLALTLLAFPSFAQTVTGSGASGNVPLWTGGTNPTSKQSNSLIVQTSTSPSRLGVNAAAPAAQLDVESPATISTGIQGVTSSTAFFAAGVFGHATGTSGVTRGLYGVADSPSGIGVHGIAAIGGQFETGSGIILKGRGFGHDRFSFDANGNMSSIGMISNTVTVPNATAISGQSIGANSTNGVGVSGKTTAWNGTGVIGTANASLCPFEICAVTGVAGSATGPSIATGVSGLATGISSTGVSGSTDVSVGVAGNASSTTASSIGVSGSVNSPAGIGVKGSGPNTGIEGIATSNAFFAAAVWGHATNLGGVTRGVYGTSDSSSGIGVHGIAATGGQFETGSGNEIIGRGFGHTNFRVNANGKVFADGGFQASGADLAESFAVQGDRKLYEPGDLMIIDRTANRRLALASQPYSTLVAGIYSTKPGLLAAPHNISDPQITAELPLAVVGVVPCKVSAENGPIEVGDLLVTSSAPGHAMKGTDRARMLGAVVGKALEPLASGKGVIQVLVTLQ